MLDDDQLDLARRTLGGLQQPLDLLLDPGPDPDDPFSRALCSLVDEVAGQAPGQLRVVRHEGSDATRRPSLTINNVVYLAVPIDRELAPFLELLVLLSASPPGEATAPTEELQPPRLDLLIAPTCPNCPQAVRACGEVVAGWPAARLTVIDVQYFTELAGACRSVPTLIIDGLRTVVGVVSAPELRALLDERSSDDYLTRALTSMLEVGRLDEAVPLITSERGLATLPAVIQAGTMQQRMGLMLVVEQTLAQDPHALDAALPHLLPLLETGDATVRGDTADLLGQIGAPGAREALGRLLTDENPDVRELAQEAVQRLRQPS